MKLAELKQALQATDPAAVLVAPHILGRVVQQVGKFPGLILQVPHSRAWVIDRHVLFRHVEQEELDLEPDHLLPSTVILLARPSPETLGAKNREAVLLEYWRLLFHANIHLALEQRESEGRLTRDDVHAHIEAIGAIEFEEIREVLALDNYLLPNADERDVYFEFVAVYLELRYFWSNLRSTYFPSISSFEKIDQLIDPDVNADALFQQSRLPGAPDPVVQTDNSSEESNDFYLKLMRKAEQAGKKGNTVRAAILRTQAGRVAPADLTYGTRQQALADLKELTNRLQTALKLTDAEALEWLKDLPALLEKADQGSWTVEARLLYDLQQVCVDHERDIYALDVFEWAISGGKRPIKRPLPSQRLVRVTKHLRSAARRLASARVTDADRQHFARLLQSALAQSEDRLRERFRPVLSSAFNDVGLQPATPPEQAAFHKMIEELLDRITGQGFFTFSDLRDTISRNQLKFPDLADPHQFFRGDPLLSLNRRLATLMDGVYRPGDFYLRGLQRLTSLTFGTESGRFVTKYLAVPFGGAFGLLEAFDLISAHFEGPSVTSWVSVLVLGLALLTLIHVPAIWQAGLRVGRAIRRGFRWLFVEVPDYVRNVPLIQRASQSWPFLLLLWYVLKPLPPCLLIWWLFPEAFDTVIGAVGIFLAVNFLLNSRPGGAAVEAIAAALVQLYHRLRAGLILGLFRFIVNLLKQITNAVEKVLFTVDEWLRFRGGDSQFSLGLRAVLGVLWFPVAYFARFYILVLVEPCFHPIKLPISSLAAKFMYPLFLSLNLQGKATENLTQFLPYAVAFGLTWSTLFLLPDAFGFIFWEMKENWRLYRANRAKALRPVVIGDHGETMLQLLRPGFHSGTVPKLYSQLRHAERAAYASGDWRPARASRHSLHEVERALRRFVERELILLLEQTKSWEACPLHVGQVALSCNQIRIELCHEEHREEPVWVAFEEHAGWLAVQVLEPGWLHKLDADQLAALATAMVGLYKTAGVHLIHEQVRAALPPGACCYDITDEGLVVWLDHRYGRQVIYDLTEHRPRLRPYVPGDKNGLQPPALDARQLIFSRVPVTWRQWVTVWEKDNAGQIPLLREGIALLPAPQERNGEPTAGAGPVPEGEPTTTDSHSA